MRFISLANQTFVRPCRSSTSLILLPMCRLIDRVFWAADDIPISDRHKKSVESILCSFHVLRLRTAHPVETSNESSRRKYNKGTTIQLCTDTTHLRHLSLLYSDRTLVERCEFSVRRKHSVINALINICIFPPAALQRRVISAKLYCFGEINKKK